MIDRATGTLDVATPEAGATLRGVRHEDHTWTITTRFSGARLAQVTLFADDATFGTSWDDYTEAKEHARRAVHDALLERDLGPAHRADDEHFSKEWTFAWGRVLSSHDPRGGSTEVQILYVGAIAKSTKDS